MILLPQLPQCWDYHVPPCMPSSAVSILIQQRGGVKWFLLLALPNFKPKLPLLNYTQPHTPHKLGTGDPEHQEQEKASSVSAHSRLPRNVQCHQVDGISVQKSLGGKQETGGYAALSCLQRPPQVTLIFRAKDLCSEL